MPEKVLIGSVKCNNEKNSIKDIKYMWEFSANFSCPELFSKDSFTHPVVSGFWFRKNERIHNIPDNDCNKCNPVVIPQSNEQ